MIGNDIVDLNFAKTNSRWQEQRFLDTLFTEEEQSFIFKNEDFRYENIWLLWSMKESAYKISSRHLKEAVFNPKSFHCNLTSSTTGVVCFEKSVMHTTTEFDSNLIYTTAQITDNIQLSDYGVLDGTSQLDKSRQLRAKAILAFAALKSVQPSKVTIRKTEFGVPQLLINNTLQENALTLTHHGQYGGFAISY